MRYKFLGKLQISLTFTGKPVSKCCVSHRFWDRYYVYMKGCFYISKMWEMANTKSPFYLRSSKQVTLQHFYQICLNTISNLPARLTKVVFHDAPIPKASKIRSKIFFGCIWNNAWHKMMPNLRNFLLSSILAENKFLTVRDWTCNAACYLSIRKSTTSSHESSFVPILAKGTSLRRYFQHFLFEYHSKLTHFLARQQRFSFCLFPCFQEFWALQTTSTVKLLYSGHLRFLKKASAIRTCPLYKCWTFSKKKSS